MTENTRPDHSRIRQSTSVRQRVDEGVAHRAPAAAWRGRSNCREGAAQLRGTRCGGATGRAMISALCEGGRMGLLTLVGPAFATPDPATAMAQYPTAPVTNIAGPMGTRMAIRTSMVATISPADSRLVTRRALRHRDSERASMGALGQVDPELGTRRRRAGLEPAMRGDQALRVGPEAGSGLERPGQGFRGGGGGHAKPGPEHLPAASIGDQGLGAPPEGAVAGHEALV